MQGSDAVPTGVERLTTAHEEREGPSAGQASDAGHRATGHGGRTALAIGLLASCAFAGLAGIRLSAQGLYYDEVHQAPAAFAYLGREPQLLTMAPIGQIPMMTMSYSGAIKPALYGLLLRITGRSFTVESWRWLGIGLVASTLPLFSVLARKRLSAAGLVLFFALLMTDGTIVLGTRHDWGPTALALALRLLFLGTWLHGEGQERVEARNSFALGVIVGLSIYEKLSNVVLLLPLLLILLSRGRRRPDHWTACLAGGVVGGLPLLIANYRHYALTGQLLSTSDLAAGGGKSLGGLARFLDEYFAVGNGSFIRPVILGKGTRHRDRTAEIVLLGILLAAIVGLARGSARNRRPALLVACFLSVAAGLYLLPRDTSVHHWVIGTPFQYLAIALAVTAPEYRPPRASRLFSAGRLALVSALAVLMIFRGQGLSTLTGSLVRGESSHLWHPSLTRMAVWCARRAGQDVFLATNWGVASQICCLSNGHPGLVREMFAEPSLTPSERLARLGPFRAVYVLQNRLTEYPPGNGVAAQLLSSFDDFPGLKEVPVEPELVDLGVVRARKFVRSDDGQVTQFASKERRSPCVESTRR